jgi:pimeloyl-ACP methyl ester carboxylesterase
MDALGLEIQMHDIDGVRTRCIAGGSGAPTLFLHGIQASAENHIRNLRPLSSGLRVLAPDLLGHGLTDKPDVAYDIADYAEHVLRLLDHLELPAVNIVGQSLGGWIGAYIAATAPQRVQRLVLNTTAGLPVDAADAAKQHDLYRMSVEAATALDPDTVRQRLRWTVKDPEHITDEVIDVRLAMWKQPGWRDIVERVTGLVLPDRYRPQQLSDELLRHITAPTLLIWTEDNPIHGVEAARRVTTQIRSAQLTVIPDAGHWPQFEQPQYYNSAVSQFLAGHATSE